MNQKYRNKRIPKKKKFKYQSHTASVGEKKIKVILKTIGIKFECEKTFGWLKSDKNYPLRLDFFLPELNKAIEFDGIYHYQKGNVRQKQNDLRKNRLCAYHKLPLLRIPYWDSDKMQDIIVSFLG